MRPKPDPADAAVAPISARHDHDVGGAARFSWIECERCAGAADEEVAQEDEGDDDGDYDANAEGR